MPRWCSPRVSIHTDLPFWAWTNHVRQRAWHRLISQQHPSIVQRFPVGADEPLCRARRGAQKLWWNRDARTTAAAFILADCTPLLTEHTMCAEIPGSP